MKLKEVYLRIKEDINNTESKETAKCLYKAIEAERELYVGDKPLDNRFHELDKLYYELKSFIEDGNFSHNREEVKKMWEDFTEGLNYSNTETYQRGEEVTHLFKELEAEKIKVWKAIGDKVLFRGVSLDDWKRINSRGKIDSDMRGSISKYEGINLGQTISTADYYLPSGKDGVILAIDPKGLNLYRLRDDYVRSFEPIPLKNVIKISDIITKNGHGATVNKSVESKIEEIRDKLKKLGIKTTC